MAHGRAPDGDAGLGHDVAPATVGLEPMVVGAEGGEVGGLGLATGVGFVVVVGDEWSTWQRRAGREHHGKAQVRSRWTTCSRSSAPGLRTAHSAGREVEDGEDQTGCGCRRTTPSPGRGGPALALLERGEGERDRCRRRRSPRGGRGGRAGGPRARDRLDVPRSSASWRRTRSPSASARRASSEASEPSARSDCAPRRTAWSRSRALARSSSASTRTVPGVGDVLVVDRHVAGVRHRGRRVVGMLGGGRQTGAGDRLGDQPVDSGGTGAVGGRRDHPVDVRRSLGSQVGVDRGLRHPASPPGRQVTGVDPAPQPRQPVTQLEGVADQPLGRGGRRAERGAELGGAEFGDQTGSPRPRSAPRPRSRGPRTSPRRGSTPAGGGRPTRPPPAAAEPRRVGGRPLGPRGRQHRGGRDALLKVATIRSCVRF